MVNKYEREETKMKWRGKKLTALLAATCLCLSTPLSAAAAPMEQVSGIEHVETDAVNALRTENGSSDTESEGAAESGNGKQAGTRDEANTDPKSEELTESDEEGITEVVNETVQMDMPEENQA